MKIILSGMFGLEGIFTSACDPVLLLVALLGCASLLICALLLIGSERRSTNRLSAVQLQAFIDSIPAQAWIDDGDGRMIYCNGQYQRSHPA
ncbi:MAG: hypothetical protein HC899_39160, partial [Leptolyngbyaceae cyanobacterium SM1_4_3]|nr:hypothetical protein [Leptolyngbyaceae cyanobacterium SM1_4_3]